MLLRSMQGKLGAESSWDYMDATAKHVKDSIESYQDVMDNVIGLQVTADIVNQVVMEQDSMLAKDAVWHSVPQRADIFEQDVRPLKISVAILLRYKTFSGNGHPAAWVAAAFATAQDKDAYISSIYVQDPDTFASFDSVQFLVAGEIPTEPSATPTVSPTAVLRSTVIPIAVRLISTSGELKGKAISDFETVTAAHTQRSIASRVDVDDVRIAANVLNQIVDEGGGQEEARPLVVKTQLLVEHRLLSSDQDYNPEKWIANAFDSEEERNSYIARLQEESSGAFRYVESVEVLVGDEDFPSPSIAPPLEELQSTFVTVAVRLSSMQTDLDGMAGGDFETITAAHIQSSIANRNDVTDVRVAANVISHVFDETENDVQPLDVSATLLLQYRFVSGSGQDYDLEDWIYEAFDNEEDVDSYITRLKNQNQDAFQYVESVQVLVGDDIPPPAASELQNTVVNVAVRLIFTRGVLGGTAVSDFETVTSAHIQASMENRNGVSDVRVAANAFNQVVDNEIIYSVPGEETQPLVVAASLFVEYRSDEDEDPEDWIRDAFNSLEDVDAYIALLEEENADAFQYVKIVQVYVGDGIPGNFLEQSAVVPIAMRLISTRGLLTGKAAEDFEFGTATHVQGNMENRESQLVGLEITADMTAQDFLGNTGSGSMASAALAPLGDNGRRRNLQDVEPLGVIVSVHAKYRSSSIDNYIPMEEWIAETFDTEEKRNAYVQLLRLLNPTAFEDLERMELGGLGSGSAANQERESSLQGEDTPLGMIVGVAISGAVLVALAAYFVVRRKQQHHWEEHGVDVDTQYHVDEPEEKKLGFNVTVRPTPNI
jgi:hypothetical protein